MRRPPVTPLLVSPIPATEIPSAPRPVSVKRLSRVRGNWFMFGSAFGIGLSFFTNLLITAAVLPQEQAALEQPTLTEVASYSQPPAPAGVVPAPAPMAATPVILAQAPETSPPPPSENAAPAATLAEAATVPATTEPAQTAVVEPKLTYPRTLALKIGRGETLLDILLANHVQMGDAQEVVTALKARFNPRKLRAGQKISLTLARHETLGDKAAVRELAINLPNFSTIELQRLENGNYNVAATKEAMTEKAYRGFGKVRSSLMQAGADAKIPAGTMNDIVKAFSYDVDFQRDIHPGDTIEVLMDRKTTADGRIGGYSPARYVALTLQGKKHEIFRFKTNGGDYAWFDGKGNSVRKSLLRTPINAAHITSGFGMRKHPLLGYSRMHKGVDFGASTGTAIMAAGDGVVEFKGWKKGYGNFVLIKHNNTYKTAYGHISKFGKISVGNRVRQGQVIAYVGMTGAATGPHLHYEVRLNNAQVNPISKQFNMASGLTGKQMAAFKSGKQAAIKELASLNSKPKATAKLASR